MNEPRPECGCPETCKKGQQANGYSPHCNWPWCIDQSKMWADPAPEKAND